MASIRVHQDLMKRLYRENDYPSDRLFKDRNALVAFTNEFNLRSHCDYTPEAVHGELERIRKDKAHSGGLPHLGRDFSGPRFLSN